MKTINFAKRNFKELIRDPMNVIFCIVLPLFLLFIFQQFKIPSKEFSIEYFTPGIIIFSYSFMSLFIAQLVAKDRSSLFLSRLYVSPMKPREYILGYVLPLIPISIIQNIIFFTAAIFLNLPFNINILYSLLMLIPISILFIALGILIGCIANDNQASAIGSLIIQVVTFTSGMWFPINLVGKIYKVICKILPFSYTVQLIRNILINKMNEIIVPILIVFSYIVITFILASFIFKKKMISDNN